MSTKISGVTDLIGGTPLVTIANINPNRNVEILAKLEYSNPGGSIKDRPALYMIEEAERSGELTKDKTILEATSGNTGIGLALVAAVKGYRILLTMSESVSEERVKILKALGAEVKFTPARLSTDGAIEYVYNLVREEPEKYWLADQFNNEANWLAHYHGTSLEIWEQTGGVLDTIVATMGTTGTLMGLARRFNDLDPEVKVVGVEPYLGHKIQGLKNMKESYRPGIFEKERLHKIMNIDDEEAFQTARMLARKEGLFVGMSSGAAMAVALKLANDMEKGRIVVILPDGGERYLSTPLFVSKQKTGLRVYNTLTRELHEFVPLEENRVTMYSCGLTLSQLIPVGQCRRYVFADLMRRYMEFKGYQVTHVMNVTDLDDRTIEGAEKAGLSLKEFTDSYYDSFLRDLDILGTKKAEAYPRASEHVQEMIDLTQTLLDKGFAYEKFRSIYFDISRFKDYGRLSKIDLKKMRLGKTVDLDQYEKDNPRDFTLLKRSTLSELKKGIFYKTKWGNIRPSWHIESSAMALKHLGPTYDIHTSGVDLIFPHHENAIAINQVITGNPPANYWVHNEMVTINGNNTEGESKSVPSTIEDLIDGGYSGRDIRYWLLSRHYRKAIVFSWSKLETAKNTVAHLDKFIQKIHHSQSGRDDTDIDQAVYDLKQKFTESMDDDFNISQALAGLFQFTRRINLIMDRNGLSTPDEEKILEALDKINSVLGVMDLAPQKADHAIESLIQKREHARKNKEWDVADSLRQELENMGIELIDTREGTVWRNIGGSDKN